MTPLFKPSRLVLLHGLASTPQEFGLVARTIRSKAVPLDLPEVPSYTAMDTRRPNRWQDWVRSAADMLERTVPANEPVSLGGLCMGGVLAAAVALETGRPIEGLALLSPTLVYDGWGLSRWCHLRRVGYILGLGRLISIRERSPFGVKNESIRKWVERELRARSMSAVGPSSLPLWALREGERMIAHVRANLGALDCPLLVMHAREDEISSLHSVREALAQWPLRDKRLVVLEDSYHMITIDNDRHRVAAELAQFAWGANRPAPIETVPMLASRPPLSVTAKAAA